MRILIATDRWLPALYGTERLLHHLVDEFIRQGDIVEVISPDRFKTTKDPIDPRFPSAVHPGRTIAPMIEAFEPDALHIATEGPVGFAARNWAMKRDRPFTTAYVNKLPEYLHARFGIPPAPTYNRLRAFHADAVRTIVPTPSIAAELNDKGFDHLVVCPFGVDADIFRPRADARLDLPRPIHISVARLTPEKNIEAFLSLDLPGSKIMVGDGPLESALKQRYPDVQFPGFVEGDELAQLYAASDLFVFPSRTDTFGLVLLEAMACGLSVAAYPVAGPIDIIANSGAGVLDEDLARAANAARTIPRERARIHALNFTWQRTAARFRSYLAPFSS